MKKKEEDSTAEILKEFNLKPCTVKIQVTEVNGEFVSKKIKPKRKKIDEAEVFLFYLDEKNEKNEKNEKKLIPFKI